MDNKVTDVSRQAGLLKDGLAARWVASGARRKKPSQTPACGIDDMPGVVWPSTGIGRSVCDVLGASDAGSDFATTRNSKVLLRSS